MKQILLSGAIALGLHVIFFVSLPILLQKNHKPAQPATKSIMVTMSYRPLKLKKENHKKKPVLKIVKKNKTTELKPKKKPKAPESIQIKKIKPAPALKTKTSSLKKTVLNSLPETETKQSIADKQIVSETSSNPQKITTLNNIKKQFKITEPAYKKKPLLKYPLKAKRRGYEGIVELMVQVSKKGKVSNLWIFKSSKYKSLDNQAVKIVRKWIFEPGKKNGKPEKMWVKIPVKFKLK